MKFPIIAAVALASCSLAFGATAASAQDASSSSQSDEKAALASAIIDRAFPSDRRMAIFLATADQMEAQVLASLSKQLDDDGALRLVKDWQAELKPAQNELLASHLPNLMDGLASAYADTFTAAELRAILDFVNTESGQSFMLKSSEIMASPAFAQANQAYMDETMTLTMERLPKLVETIVAYKAEQSGASTD